MENYSIKVERKGKNNNMLYDVMIYNHSDNQGNINVSISDSGKMEITQDKKFMSITLYNGQNYTEDSERGQGGAKRYPFRRQSFQKEVINLSMKDFEFNRMDEKRWSGASKMMNVSQLAYQGDSLFKDYNFRLWRYLTAFSYISDINQQVSWLSNPNDSLRHNPKIKPDSIVDFDKTINALTTFEKGALYQRAISNVRSNSLAISQQLDDMYGRKKMLNSYPMEWHRKFTLSFACLIFFFIGAPLGAIIRKGGLGMPVVVSILMFIAYYILMITGEKFAREDAWSMMNGMWFASFVFLPIGIWLTYKAATDSGVMNMESYQALFKRIISFRLFKQHKPE
jgi:lipopolysaccharide export system permease protein